MVIADEACGDSSTIVLDLRNLAQVPPSVEHVSLQTEQGAILKATVAWESFRSIGAIIDPSAFNLGDIVEVEYGGLTMPAQVRRIDEQPDGVWIAVLHWGPAPVRE